MNKKSLPEKLNLFLSKLYFKQITDGKALEEVLHNEQFSQSEENSIKLIKYIREVRFKNVRAAIIHSPATTLSLLFSLVSILIGIIILVFKLLYGIIIYLFEILNRVEPSHFDPNFNLTDSIVATISLVFLILIIYYLPKYLQRYIQALTLEDYASFIKNSLSESEMISFISYRVWILTNGFEELVKNFGDEFNHFVMKEFKSEKISDEQLQAFIKKYTREKTKEKVESYIKEVEKETPRILTLMLYCSDRLRIPIVELSEHVFEFSPSMFLKYCKKFDRNIQEILHIQNNYSVDNASLKHIYKADEAIVRQFDLLNECQRFYTRTIGFKRWQCQNIAFHDLHTDIIEFSSTSSSSDALKAYIRIFTAIAKHNNLNIEHVNSKKYFNERIAYTYHKRKAHTGIDLHHSFCNLLNEMKKDADYKKDSALSDYFKTGHNIIGPEFKKRMEEKRWSLEEKGIINSLQYFTTIYIEKFRNEIANDFLTFQIDQNESIEQLLISWTEQTIKNSEVPNDELLVPEENCQNDGINLTDQSIPRKERCNIYVITFGYSKMIREIMKKAFLDKKMEEYTKKFNIIIFLSEEETKIDSRLIKYYLTEDKNIRLENALVSHPEFILPLLNKDSKLLILLGAEVVNLDCTTIRTHSYKEMMVDFLKKSRARILSDFPIPSEFPMILNKKHINEFTRPKLSNELYNSLTTNSSFLDQFDIHNKFYKICRTIVVAESFKKFDFNIMEHFDDQYEKIEAYESELISTVITNKH